MLLHDFAKESIKRGSPNKSLEKAISDAKYQKAIYTGKEQDYILYEYRKAESDNQKKQRSRISITRTKHKGRQIENTINQLEVMDKPAIKVLHENPEIVASLDSFIQKNNIKTLAFDYVKYYGAMTDANAFTICGINEFSDVEYTIVGVNNLYDFRIVNKNLKYVIFYKERKVKKETVIDYTLYHDEGVVKYTNSKGKDIEEKETVSIESRTYIVSEIPTPLMFAYGLGFIDDMSNDQQTKLTLIDSASELFRALIWQGSELDTIDATHGILKKRAYAPRCNYSGRTTGGDITSCVQGQLHVHGAPSGSECPKCTGGLLVHKTSQDVHWLPLPNDLDNLMDLSKLESTLFIPTEILDYKQKRIKDIEEDIITTVFNSSMVTQDDIDKTATKTMVDLQGIYATLNQVGQQVSSLFVWMVKCAAHLLHEEEVEVIHGYTLNLKLEDVSSLIAKRGKALENNAPIEVIRAFDMAILKKQHLDSPKYINRFVIWDSYKPFNDKTDQQAQSIIARLPDTFRDKVLYNFFGRIRKNIENNKTENKKDFYELEHEDRLKLIDAEIDKIIEELKALDTGGRINFDDLDG